MRHLPFLIILLYFAGYAHFPQDMYVMPVQKDVKIHGNRFRKLNEEALFQVTLNCRLKVLVIKENLYKIKDNQGRVGWVEKQFVAPITKSSIDIYTPAEVYGYHDIRSFFSIFGIPDQEEVRIKLDRSFKENLKEHVDRETVERIVKY